MCIEMALFTNDFLPMIEVCITTIIEHIGTNEWMNEKCCWICENEKKMNKMWPALMGRLETLL